MLACTRCNARHFPHLRHSQYPYVGRCGIWGLKGRTDRVSYPEGCRPGPLRTILCWGTWQVQKQDVVSIPRDDKFNYSIHRPYALMHSQSINLFISLGVFAPSGVRKGVQQAFLEHPTRARSLEMNREEDMVFEWRNVQTGHCTPLRGMGRLRGNGWGHLKVGCSPIQTYLLGTTHLESTLGIERTINSRPEALLRLRSWWDLGW